MPEGLSAATDLDLISYLKAIPVVEAFSAGVARMRRGVRIPAWYLLLVAVLGILSRCQSLRDLERYSRRRRLCLCHPTPQRVERGMGIELSRPPSDSAFHYFFRQVDVATLSAAIRD